MYYTEIAIIGGGFGGLSLARKLAHTKLQITLIDKKNHHLFQPLLYQVATAALSPADIAAPLREIFSKSKNINVMMGEVVAIDKEKKVITFGNGDHLKFSKLVIATGASHSYFGHTDWEANAPGLKTIVDALKIREKILLSFEKAERLHDKEEAAKYLNFVVIGGGPTGVEMAGAIAEIAYNTMFENFRKIDPHKSRIYLIEAMDRILPPYPFSLSKRAQKDLEKLGVEVMTNCTVTDVTGDGVQIGNRFIPSKNIIWAAGNQASPLLKTLGTEATKSGTVVVGPDLSIPSYPDIFVIGDAASCKGKDGKPLPAVAPVAIQQGYYLAKKFKKKTSAAFKYFDKGSMATIGKAKAVGFTGNFKFTGFIAWIAWLALHVLYLANFRNRLSVGLQWFFHYVLGTRGARLIYKTIDEELPKSE
jgi:NADH dehydrogenase